LLLPAVAARPVGAAGGRFGVAFASEELTLSPVLLVAETV